MKGKARQRPAAMCGARSTTTMKSETFWRRVTFITTSSDFLLATFIFFVWLFWLPSSFGYFIANVAILATFGKNLYVWLFLISVANFLFFGYFLRVEWLFFHFWLFWLLLSFVAILTTFDKNIYFWLYFIIVTNFLFFGILATFVSYGYLH